MSTLPEKPAEKNEKNKNEKKTANEKKGVVVAKTAADIQRMKLEKLMKNPSKPAYIPERPTEKLPRAFNPPEIVRNIWGSSAGAGSGDFHVYRGVRRREYARQKYLDEKSKKDSLNQEYVEKLVSHKTDAEEKTAKKRAKRLKKREKERRSKEAKKAKIASGTNNGTLGENEKEQKSVGSDDGSDDDDNDDA